MRIGFLINPVAGMGGRVGLKGTDGMYEEAVKRGATEVSPRRAEEFLKNLHMENLEFLVPSGKMGSELMEKHGTNYRIIYHSPDMTTAEDTKKACMIMKKEVDLIVFVGGDGTARDVVEEVGMDVPIIGVPAGVKMYSSCFCVTPAKCALVVESFLKGDAKLLDAEIMDIDEEAYRENRLKIRLYGFARVPYIPDAVQSSKSEYYGDEDDKEALAEFFAENVEDDVLYLLGAGTTVYSIARALGVDKTLLGIDAYCCGEIVGKDLDEEKIWNLLKRYDRVKLVVTPIGSQGFVFGRGNQQLSDRILHRIGKENIIIVATPKKISEIKVLRIDIEDPEPLRGYYRVLIGYGKYRVMKME